LPLLQATNPQRFSPDAGLADSGERVLFVGSTRGEFRPIVRDALTADLPLSLYGVGWQEFVPSECITADFLPNASLPAAYASAQIVLNDHHAYMAELGFLSNRLFDTTATATRVISDQVLGLHEVFGDIVRTYESSSQLQQLAADPQASFASYDRRLDFARTVAHEHSFAARAQRLIAHATQLRDS
ncbi:MAG: hypothetical protein Q7K25_00700, partial [Actinomycetota bacterium]|nr:hypothetical protein [Actinomycetota bacterium]